MYYLEFSKDPESIFYTTDELVYFKDDKLHTFSRSMGPQAPAVKINCLVIILLLSCVIHCDNEYAVYVLGTELEKW